MEVRNVLNKENDGAWCTVVTVGEIKVMIDCGCNEVPQGTDMFELIWQAVQDCDYLFITHAHHMMMGALAYLHNKGLAITVFATSPVAKLGNQTLMEFIIQKKEFAVFDLFSMQDVQAACAKIELVAFDEYKTIKKGDTTVTFSAFPSGSSIGGSCFKFELNNQTLVYAIEIND